MQNSSGIIVIIIIIIIIIILPNAATCSYELPWFPSWLWQ